MLNLKSIKMKKIILIIIGLCSFSSFSQKATFGLKTGFNASNLRGDYPSGLDNKTIAGLHVGGFFQYSITEKLSIQTELLFSTQGSKIQQSTGSGEGSFDQTVKLAYINLPIMAQYKVLDKLTIDFGPQIGYLVSAKNKWAFSDPSNTQNNEVVEVDLISGGDYSFFGTTYSVRPDTNRLDFGLNIGSTYEISKHLFAQVRYNFGLSEFEKKNSAGENSLKWGLKNDVLQLSIGYKF